MTDWDKVVPRYGEGGPSWWIQVAPGNRFVQFVDVIEYEDPKPDYPWWYLLWREFGLEEVTGGEIPVHPEKWPHDPIIFVEDPNIVGVELQPLSEEHTVFVTRGWEGELPASVLERIVTLQEFLFRERGIEDFSFNLRLRFGKYSDALFGLEITMTCRDDAGESEEFPVAQRAEGEWVTCLGENSVASMHWRTLNHLDREWFRSEALKEGNETVLSLDWAEPLVMLWDLRLPLQKHHFDGFSVATSNSVNPRDLPTVFRLVAEALNGLGSEGLDEPPVEITDAVLTSQNHVFPSPGILVEPLVSLTVMAEALTKISAEQLIASLCNSVECADDAIEMDQDFSWSSWLIEFLAFPFERQNQTGAKQCFSVFATNYDDYSTADFFFDAETGCLFGTPSPEPAWNLHLDSLADVPGAERWESDRHSSDTGGFNVRKAFVDQPEVAFAVILRALRVMGWNHQQIRLKLMVEVVGGTSRAGQKAFG